MDGKKEYFIMMTLENFEKAYETVQKVILETKLVYSDYY